MARRWVLGLLALLGLGGPAGAAEMNLVAATYNLRLNLAADGPDAWPLRRDAVRALIQRHGIELLATQEGLADQIDDLAQMPGYAHVGVGRDDGRRGGEHAAIFYRSARFERLAAGDFWLSQTPDQPSKGWDARCCNRLASWVRLRDRSTGIAFVALSVHLDHEGVVARRESARLILARLQELARDDPVLCLGDFNATPESEPIAILSAGLRDAYRVSATPPQGPVGTFNGFQLDVDLKERIDYIFVGPRWRVLSYAALSDRANGRFPSDHLPVLARLAIDHAR